MSKTQIVTSFRLSALKEKIKSHGWSSLLAYFLIFMSGTQLVLAESGDSSVTSRASSVGFYGWIFMWLICNERKRKAIGGWLLFYYIQLFGKVILSILLIFESLEVFVSNLNIANWGDETMQYFLYVISVIPADIILIIELILGSMLLSKKFRNRKIYNFLRIAIATSFGFGLLALIIDLNFWPEDIAFDVLPMIGSAFWFLYFTFSKRVKLVFVDNKWNPDVIYIPKGENAANYITCSSCGLKCKNSVYVCPYCGEKFWQSRKDYEKFLADKKSS